MNKPEKVEKAEKEAAPDAAEVVPAPEPSPTRAEQRAERRAERTRAGRQEDAAEDVLEFLADDPEKLGKTWEELRDETKLADEDLTDVVSALAAQGCVEQSVRAESALVYHFRALPAGRVVIP